MPGFAQFPESLDANEPIGKIFNFKPTLPSGDTLTAASVTVVNPDSGEAEASPIVTISEVAFALISGTQWGVSFRAQGTGVSGKAYLRLRFETSSDNGDDKTAVLVVEQR